MKKLLPFLMVIFLGLFFAGCTENTAVNETANSPVAVEPQKKPVTAAEPNGEGIEQTVPLPVSACETGETAAQFKLGDELLMDKYNYLVAGKRVGLVTNQSGVTSKGESIIDLLAVDGTVQLAALYGPEHGIDGTASAGAYVESYIHPSLGIPVYSLYGSTRMPTAEMLGGIDILVFDIQDIGARSYTYMSTLNYCLVAAQKYNLPVLVLDRPNPVGGVIVEGPVLEDLYISFVGVDNLPMAHGMTAGELATGLGEGTGIVQADKFKWIGGKGIDSQVFASLLNNAGLPGVAFFPETRGDAGGVRLNIQDYHAFNPARTGIYALTYAHSLNNFTVPKSGQTIVMFEKIMGSDKIGLYLEQGLTPQQIEANYAPALNRFKEERKQYLIY